MRMRPGVYAAIRPDGHVVLVHAGRRAEHLGQLTPGQHAALRRMGAGWHTEDDLCGTLAGVDGWSNAALLRRLLAGGWVAERFEHAGLPLITVRPLGPPPESPGEPLLAPTLSRFALLRMEVDALVLESPLARAAVTVHDAAVLTVLHRLASGQPSLAAGDLPAGIVAELITTLGRYGFVHDASQNTGADLANEQWSPHELWFHSRSRTGSHDEPFGATQWAVDRFDPLPVRREPFGGTPVALPRPDLDTLADPPLTAVLESRRSIRGQDAERPLTLAQLGEFLYRTARVVAVADDGPQGVSLRPTPSGGALHGLEIYPVITNVAGLAAGMYHYDPFDHLLEPLRANEFAVRGLVERAAAGAGGAAHPQALLVVSCRFGRVMWKYQSMAYALILKDLGALFQTMYLVATAMGLAPCALGAGDTELFALATGLDQLTEGSVGEFMLSSRPASDAPTVRA
jgi:SagB-type dehydrogenase family enzyme